MRLADIPAMFPANEVLVLGDVMLDEYVWGEVRRISPEAPVPVVECRRRTYAPGGAANVAVNVASLAGKVSLGGVVGADDAAEHLRRTLRQADVEVSGLISDKARPTTTKTRIVAHNQQVVRVDSELCEPIAAEIEAALLEWASSRLNTAGACVLSDYSKGVVIPSFLQRLAAAARAIDLPVIVDPKGTDYTRYRGATIITPNIPEVERALNRSITNEADVDRAGRNLIEQIEGGAVLITRGSEGMSLFIADAPRVDIPTVARNVYDVTGAGDTVVSTLALALAAGASIEQAARLANHAAGIVVGKLGTARVTTSELLDEFDNSEGTGITRQPHK